MAVYADAERLQASLERIRCGLSLIAGQNHASHIETVAAERIDQTQNI